MTDIHSVDDSRRSTRSRHGIPFTHLRRAERYIKNQLVWGHFYRALSYAKSALWVVPLVAILLVLVTVPGLRALDAWLQWRVIGLDMTGAQTLYQTVITLTLTFMVFTFGSLLVAIQIAGGQLTPRIIATTLLRDNVVRYSVGLFVFTLVFAVMALNRLDKNVPELAASITALLGIACMATFLFLIDYAARLLRPVTIVGRIGEEGLSVIEAVYPQPVGATPDSEQPQPTARGAPRRVVAHRGDSAILLAVDVETIVREARATGGIVELIPQVGDFVASEEPLFALYDGAAAIDERKLRAAVAFGSERTMEQDPMFAFRILVDIGLKALSRAINDPTTAVLALDQIHRLLKAVGKRHLQLEEIKDGDGALRLVYRTPNWEDYVNVSCNEIRACGASSVQVARRLRAMIENVATSLPAHRRTALHEERDRLDRAIEPLYAQVFDLELARIPDSQGLGGSSTSRTAAFR